MPTLLRRIASRAANLFKTPMVFFVKGLGTNPFNTLGSRQTSVLNDPAGSFASWAYVAITKRAGRIAATQTILYDLRGKDLVEIEEAELIALLDHPNSLQDRYGFFYTLEMFLCLWGKAPVLKFRNGGKRILQLWPLRPDLLTTVFDNAGRPVSYTYSVGATIEKYALEDVVMILEPSPRSLYAGYSPMMAAAIEIDMDTAAALWNKHLLENFAEPGAVLSTDGKLDDAKAKEVISAWRKRHAGPSNAGAVTVLDRGLKYEAAGRSPDELQLKDTRAMAREAIVSVLGVPVSLITSAEVTFSNMETAERIFARDTIEPELRLIFGAMNEFLVPEFSVTEWLDFESPVKEDENQKIALASAGEGRWLTVNDARDIFGYEPLDGGDFIFKPFGLTPAVGAGLDPVGDAAAASPPPAELPKGFLKVPMRRKAGWYSPKMRDIRRKILGRTFLVRMTQAGIADKVIARITARAGVEGKGIVRATIKGAKLKVKDKVEVNDRLKAERLEFLKRLPRHQQNMRKDIKKYFAKQRAEVLGKLEQTGLPKGMKLNIGNWIYSILFDEGVADHVLVQLAARHIYENVTAGAEAIQGLTGMPSPGGGILGTPFVHDFIDKRSGTMLGVNDTTREKLAETLHEGFNSGEDLGQIRNRITAVYDQAEGFRAETIARTEVGMAQNFGRNEEMRVQGAERKVWLCIFSNSRESHEEAHGDVVRVQDAFTVGGYDMDYPGDPSAPASETISCQCSVSPTLDDLS